VGQKFCINFVLDITLWYNIIETWCFFFVRKNKVSSAKIHKRIWLERSFEGHKNLRTKFLVQKYIKEFDWKRLSKATKILEQKALENFVSTLVTLSSPKNICLTFFITHCRRFRAPYLYSCSLQRRLAFSIKIIDIAYTRTNRGQSY
jgi:hypothetical protein